MTATWNPQKGFGTANRGRFSDPTVDALLDKALATGDDKAREQILIEATRAAMAEIPFIPLHIQKNIWAMRASMAYAARADEETHVQDLRPTK